MKRISLFAALLLILTGSSSAWSPYSLTQHVLQRLCLIGKPSSSRIPQFILDTNHPWLATNKGWLSRYPHVAEELCSLDSSLWTSPHSPGHVLPADLFTKLLIKNNNGERRICQEPLGWSNLSDRLQEIATCEASLTAVRHLHVNVHVHDDGYSRTGEDSTPPPGLPELFADVLAQMSNLERLDWGISSDETRGFEPAFASKGLMLPSVRYLKPGPRSDYLVSRCPNVEVLDAEDHSIHWSWTNRETHPLQLIKAATGLRNIKEWRLSRDWPGWTLEMVKAIVDATPNITSLRMDGNLHGYDATHELVLDETEWTDPYYGRGPCEQTLERYLQLLALFPNLESLRLPASHELDLGFDGGHFCGNAYDGPKGRAYGRRVTQEGAETTELAANITLGALPSLKSLSIGPEYANLTSNDRGQPDMTWPWTGRMEQYTHEMQQVWE